MTFQADSEKDLVDKVWERISQISGGGVNIGLVGDLGAGKTALVRGIARKLGVEGPITSPTFNLRKSYRVKKTGGADNLQHIDLYRFERGRENDLREIDDWLSDQSAITFVEWIDNIPELLWKANIIVRIKSKSEKIREVEIENRNKVSR